MAQRILNLELGSGDRAVSARHTGDDVTEHMHDDAGQAHRPGSAGGKVFAAVVLAAWLALIVALGATQALTVPPGTPPYPIALAVGAPLVLFFAAFWLSAAFRSWVAAIDLPLIAALEGWRWAGFGFLTLWAYGVLPGAFAWPAGLGDMAIGFTAPWVVLALVRRPGFAASRLFAAWNLLGILDLVAAVSNAAIIQSLASGAPGEITVAPMAVLPLLLIPGYLVPLFIMLHVAALFRRRQLRTGSGTAA
jgi:hypothetical protein